MFSIYNDENTSHGKGLNENHYKWYMERGVNVITLGNHSY
ncbi:MAG: YmdB family metallophosphoesterase, partial [Bacilli bacterium]|nr:YmdB family metallophosphoesterase [Bacilli bacterium]